MTVKLSDFVKEALLEISNGVVSAREEARITIAPGAIEGNPIFEANQVHFEIYVEVLESSRLSGSAEAGGAILSVIKAQARGDGEKNSSATSSQKISFSVPVHFNSDNVRRL